MRRQDWLKVARGVTSAAYWRGMALPALSYGWYLQLVQATTDLARSTSGCKQVSRGHQQAAPLHSICQLDFWTAPCHQLVLVDTASIHGLLWYQAHPRWQWGPDPVLLESFELALAGSDAADAEAVFRSPLWGTRLEDGWLGPLSQTPCTLTPLPQTHLARMLV